MEMRKLIAHGPSSLTIALPHKWISKYELRKGDQVAVAEDDYGLRVQPGRIQTTRSIIIDLSRHDEQSVQAVMTNVYRRGYDEIRAKYKAPASYEHIAAAVRNLLGLAIMDTRNNVVLIKSLPTQLEQDFATLFRRVFFNLLQKLEDLESMLDNKAALAAFYKRDADLNAIVNLAIRMIHKGMVHNRSEELQLFHSLLMLEEMGDDLLKFSLEVQREKNPKELRDAVMATARMLRLLHDAYFQKAAHVPDFYKEYYVYFPEFKEKAPLYTSLAKLSNDGKPVFYLRSIVEKIVALAELLLLPETKME